MATTLEIVTWLRELLDDEVQPYLWTTSYLLRGLNDAEEQACRRAYCILDKLTASVCQITLSASVATFALHSKILQVRRVNVGSTDVPVIQKTREYLDENIPGWWSVQGVPEYYIVDTDHTITFYPMPQSLDTASMIVARLPLVSMKAVGSGDGYVPEIPEEFHRDLLIWGQRAAYMKNDADTFNLELAQKFEDEFTAKFGPLPSARDERLRKTRARELKARPREFGF
jgi:hypothetical protein